MTLDDTIARLRSFRDARDWERYHTPGNLAAAISVEAGELLELFEWGATPTAEAVCAELSDVVIYALNLAEALDVDVLAIVNAKIDENETREWKRDGTLE